MSELLAETAPLDDFEVPEAPESFDAVESDSGEGLGKQVPAERFNGLMSKFNKTQEQLDAERQYRMQLEDRLNQIEAASIDINPKENAVTDVTNLQSQVEMLTNMLARQQVESTRRDVLNEFPDIAPFVDLIEAPDPESFRSLASTLNERVQVIKVSNGATNVTPNDIIEAVDPVGTVSAAPEVEVPVFGGGSGAMAPAEGSQDRIAEAIKNRDFGAFMRAKTEQSSSELEL